MGTAPAALTSPPAVAAAEEASRALPRAPLDESALAWSERGRDPFHAAAPAPVTPPEDTRPRKSRHYAVDQLQLVGVVTHVAEPRAVLVDPRGKGWIVSVGDLVGRAEGEVSWKVDRIRAREIVLARADEASGAAATRTLSMREDQVLREDD
jgi:type IV pilus assembly protein PilP